MTEKIETLAIVGVGLIGGSIGLAARQRELAERIVGIGRRAERLNAALRRGAVTETSTQLADGVQEADLIVICTPVQSIARFVAQAVTACKTGAVVTDAGSTKQVIVEEIEQLCPEDCGRFIGSHPLAGSHASGVEHAEAELFVDRTVVVTPTVHSHPAAEQQVSSFWQALGARVVTMSPYEHDRAVSVTSHLPHVVASLLAAATAEAYLPLAASGWRDTTRVAAGDVQLWQEILEQNREHVLRSVDDFAKLLASFRQALAQNDFQRIAELLAVGKQRRDAVGN